MICSGSRLGVWLPSCSHESESRSVVSDSLQPHGLDSPWNSPGQNTGVGSLSLLQEIFSTQASNPGVPRCRQILYQLSYKGSPRILEWVARSPQPRDWTQVSHIAGGFFTSWATREAQEYYSREPIPCPADLPNPGMEPGSPDCRCILYLLSYQGNPIPICIHM